MPKPTVLTEADAAEIYYALQTKLMLVEQDHYRLPAAQRLHWAKQLKSILRKIGPDGCQMLAHRSDCCNRT